MEARLRDALMNAGRDLNEERRDKLREIGRAGAVDVRARSQTKSIPAAHNFVTPDSPAHVLRESSFAPGTPDDKRGSGKRGKSEQARRSPGDTGGSRDRRSRPQRPSVSVTQTWSASPNPIGIQFGSSLGEANVRSDAEPQQGYVGLAKRDE